jgi:uncharacterized protein DUF559
MRYTDVDRRIEALAGKQFGAFSRQQAFELGASERFVQRRLEQHYWTRVVPAVFVLTSSDGTWKRQCKIAELSVDDSAIAGLSAAAMHELTGFRPGRVEVVAPVNSCCTHPFATVHRYAGARLTTVEGIRVTTVAQSLFDVSSRVSPWRLERAMDDALLARRVALGDLDERLEFYEGSRRPGLPRIRPLVLERRAEGWTPPESELESLLLSVLGAIADAGPIIRQAAVPWRTARPGRVDALLPAHRLIIEADGRRWHARVNDFDRDAWRDNEATAHGYGVLHFTWVHLNHLGADVVDVIRRTITRRATPSGTDG